MSFKADLESAVKEIFAANWTEREVRSVPTARDLSLGNYGEKLSATVLYADMADSTDLVNRFEHPFATEVYKTYLSCAAKIIKSEQGAITAYDGDRVMAVFISDSKNTEAVRSAMKIHYIVQEVINPLLREHYPKRKYRLKHIVGIDTSELFIARIGVRNDNDLVWVGRAANYAAKLCSLDDKYPHPLYITGAVFDDMDDEVKYDGESHSLMWHKDHWAERNNMKIYGSSWSWNID